MYTNSTLHTQKEPMQTSKYAYFSWLLLLVSWMQGMAVFHITLVLCILLSARYIPQAIQRLKVLPWLTIPFLLYEVIRLISTLLSEYPDKALIGIFDDFRAFTFALLTLIFLQTKDHVKEAAWATFIGFTILAWWALLYHLFTHNFSLSPSGDVIVGSFGHVNYSAIFSSIAMLIMISAFAILQGKKSWLMLIGIIPIAILQLPLGSRTTMLVTAILLITILIILRSWRGMITITALGVVFIGALSLTPSGLSQFASLSHVQQQIEGKGGIPSIQIRWEIFQVLSHLSLPHPFGLGPRAHGFVDLNAERDFLREHFKSSSKYMYGFTTDDPRFDTFDFNHPYGPESHPLTYDPHSQYTATIAETGIMGLLALLAIYISIIWHCYPLIRRKCSLTQKIMGISGIILVAMFSLGGITVIVFSQAGANLMFGFLTFFIAFQSIYNGKTERVRNTN